VRGDGLCYCAFARELRGASSLSTAVKASLVMVSAQYFSIYSMTSSVPAAWETKGFDAGLNLASVRSRTRSAEAENTMAGICMGYVHILIAIAIGFPEGVEWSSGQTEADSKLYAGGGML
jgi:hypothetical protein